MARLDRSDDRRDTIAERIRDFPRVEEALRQGVLTAIREHKQKGLPMVVERNGKITWVPAEELEAEILAEERSRS